MRISDWSSDVCSSDLRKRPELFIESIAALIARQPGRPIYGLMFGAALDNRTQSALEQKVQMLKLGEHVRFMGWRTPGVRWIAACVMMMVPRSEERLVGKEGVGTCRLRVCGTQYKKITKKQ